ncbi:BamA/TamA family outer membrane protein [Nostoc sp. KVJ3]|uniref:ShlB/FhaC/HecB family hemolysin secretion/activation protein n=1 Tax=Nostoc sp. KVJ3 TaxID=457945 RepID=UPI002238E250|nr:ShlB/FhaC/HecB family hemolysin secretion/activation protein [Nostoc sp. KVJ3]MCW5313758.1 BamA/TamA family outer membrane protein [Nostoc sp. KVJ3]
MRKEADTVVKPRKTTQQRIVCFSHELNTWRSLATTKWSQYSFSLQSTLLILPTVGIVTANALQATANTLSLDSDKKSNQPELQIVQETNPQSSPPQPETPQRIRVRKIKVVDSSVFKEKDFDPVVKPFEERDLTLEEIRQAADAVTQLYLNKGYINSRAIPETQQPSTADGVVVIRVIEGRLSEIDIEGTRQLNPSYIRSRIELGAGIPLNTGKLEEQLKLLRLDPLFTNVEARLRPTGKVGQSVLIVRVEEAKPLSGSLGVDNYSPPSIGAERLGIELRDRNLTGMGDELAGSYYHTLSGGSDAFDFSYQIPVNAMNGKVQIRAALNRSKITEPPFNAFGIRANQDLYEINYRQPLMRSPKEEFALSLGFTYQDGQTFLFDNLATPFGIGPDANGVSRTSVIKFGQDYIRREPQGAWYLRSQFNFGIDILDATINKEPIPDGRFFSWLGQVQRVQQLSDDHLLLIQADLQLTPDSLLPSQQFVIGGAQSVRGYRQNIRSGDNGFRVAIEDRITVQRDESGLSTIQLAPFVDTGAVWNNSNNPNSLPNQTFLVGAGLGLLWNQAMGIDNLFLRLDYGFPFIDLSDRGNNAQDDGFYFSLRYQP